MISSEKLKLGYQLLRIALGISIFMHGLVRLGPNFTKFINWLVGMFSESFLPEWLIIFSGWVIVAGEVLIGLMILIGVRIVLSLVSGTFLMFLLMIGMCLLQKWDVVAIHLNYIMIYAILIALSKHNEPIWKIGHQIKDAQKN